MNDDFETALLRTINKYDDTYKKVQEDIVSLAEEFDIITTYIDGSLQYSYEYCVRGDTYKYNSSNDNNINNSNNSNDNGPSELLYYRRDLIDNRIECNAIEIPGDICCNNEKILTYLKENNVKRGDVIHFESNEHKVFPHNGHELLELNNTNNTNNTNNYVIPKEFNICVEFPPNYYRNTRLCNSSVYLKLYSNEIEQIMYSLDHNNDNANICTGYFTRKTRTYKIVFFIDNTLNITEDDANRIIYGDIYDREYYDSNIRDNDNDNNDNDNDNRTLYCYIHLN